MSGTYEGLTSYQKKYIDSKIHAASWNKTKFLDFFRYSPGVVNSVNPNTGARVSEGGLMKSVGEGLEEVTITNWEKMKPGQIAGGLQDIPTQYIKLKVVEEPLMYLATKISIKQQSLDAWANNDIIKAKDMIGSAINQAMFPLINQIDQFIAYGDNMKDALSHDYMKNAGKWTGLFNGFQTFAGGPGVGDNNMAAAGDYIATYVNGKENLVSQGFDAGPYYILSDYKTASAAQQGANLYKTYVPLTEKKSLEKMYKDELGGWIDSINGIPGSSSTAYRMAITQPFISQRGAKIEPAYALYVGYNFRVFSLWKGGLSNELTYDYVIAWSGRLQEIGNGSNALYHTGDLTLT